MGNEVGKKNITFDDASEIAATIFKGEYELRKAIIYYNTFKTLVSYNLTQQTLYGLNAINEAPDMYDYDSVDDIVLKGYMEYTLASLIFFAMKESLTSEQSARMTAMGAATKNAGEMIE